MAPIHKEKNAPYLLLPAKQWAYPGPDSHIRDSLQNKISVIQNKWIF